MCRIKKYKGILKVLIVKVVFSLQLGNVFYLVGINDRTTVN